MPDLSAALRQLPSVDRVLSDAALAEAIARLPRELVADAARRELEQARAQLRAEETVDASAEALAQRAARALEARFQRSLRLVVNATGVVIHTNLGRAPVSEAAARAMAEAASRYSTLEYDVEAGSRGSRSSHLEELLTAVTGAEAGVVVNNNAAALYLVMSVYGAGREVIVSRGQAVEIGGGFRIPDVVRQSGARLVEVGTTNRTRATDYANAIGDDTAALLRVHPSNFRITGFVEEAPLSAMRKVADEARRRSQARPATPYLVVDESGRRDLKRGPMLIDDIGSGCLLDTRAYGLSEEPRPQDSVAAGADLVLFSGDKLLGGPQAGVIVGGEGPMEPLRRHPLMRALRPDKTAIAGLAATLEHYLAGEAESEVPVWAMIAANSESLRLRAISWRDAVGVGEVVESESAIGGGSLPGETRPTWVWTIPSEHPSRLARFLRSWETPVIARVTDDHVLLDPRTVFAAEDETVVEAVRAAIRDAG